MDRIFTVHKSFELDGTQTYSPCSVIGVYTNIKNAKEDLLNLLNKNKKHHIVEYNTSYYFSVETKCNDKITRYEIVERDMGLNKMKI